MTPAALTEADRLVDDLNRHGRHSDLIVGLLEDEVTANIIADLALDVVLSVRGANYSAADKAMVAFNRWVEAQAYRRAGDA